MAFKSVVNYYYKVAERADRRGMHATAELIREELEDYHWSGFNSKIVFGVDNAFIESKLDASLEDMLPKVASFSGYSVDELRKFPHIQEYFDYAKRTEMLRAELEREVRNKYGRKD